MATDIVNALFGVTPEAYQQAQQDRADAQALQYARLDPFQQANFAIGRGAYGLAGAIGGALGGQDPELQRITLRQQIAGQLNPNDPTTFDRGVELLRQSGDGQGAMMLQIEADKARQVGLVRKDEELTRQDLARKRAAEAALLLRQQDAQRIVQGAYKPGEAQYYGEPTQLPLRDEEGNLMPGAVEPKPSFDIQSVAPELMRTAEGRLELEKLQKAQTSIDETSANQLASQLFNPDGTRNKAVESRLRASLPGQKILKSVEPEVKEVNRKLLERTPTGWKLIVPEGAPSVAVSSENAITSLIQGGAINSSILPYATQISKRFASADPEDQEKLLKSLTELNNSANAKEESRTAREINASQANVMRSLQASLIKIQIQQATDKAAAAKDGKPIGLTDSTKLADRSTAVDKLVSLAETFKPEYAGFGTEAIGSLAVFAAGKSKDPNSIDLFQWWQGYQEHVNKVRNDLFGAALTAPEKAEFEKAMVTKGMNSNQAAANLKRQADLSLKAYNKLEGVLVAQGYSKAGLQALKPTGFRPDLSNFVAP